MNVAAKKYYPLVVIGLLLAVGLVFSNADEHTATGQADKAADEASKGDAKPTFTVGKSEDITITSTDLTEMPTGSKRFLTNQATINVKVRVKPHGKAGDLVLYADRGTQNQDITTSATPTDFSAVALRENETNTISASFTSGDNLYQVTSNPISIKCDMMGPMLQHAEVIDVPTTGITLVVTFDDDDFDKSTVLANAFEVLREDKGGGFTSDTMSIQGTPIISGNTIRLAFASLPAGQYQLTVQADKLKDIAGNFAGGGTTGAAKTFIFSVLERQFGEHIEFPPYAPPKQQTIPDEGFNPGDYVETRVARLFYYRDAHRVAQIINRNIRSFNQAAVTLAERAAENSRDAADKATDERRENERKAVRAAQQARNAENKLAAATENLRVARDLDLKIVENKNQIGDIDKIIAPAVAARTAAVSAKKTADTMKQAADVSLARAKQSEQLAKAAEEDKLKAEQAANKYEIEKTEADQALAVANSEKEKANGALAAAQTLPADPPGEVKKSEAVRSAQARVTAAETNVKTAAVRQRHASERFGHASTELGRVAGIWTTAKGSSTTARNEWIIAQAAAVEADAIYQAKAKKAAEESEAVNAEARIAEKTALEAENARLAKQIEGIVGVAPGENGVSTTGIQSRINAMEQSISNLRQMEITEQEAWDQSEATEARARAKQFRDEVSAAEEDPDTYVAGDLTSVDPVTQVSISVIGEGLIHLRGPIKGINKIRTMINQIDSPVGQIKIGIFSVQVNGEKGDKMEKVIGDAESNIDLSRFLVNHSLELLRKAIQAEAATIAAGCETGGHYQVDRDRRYLYAFFGRDFIDELYELDSEFLKTQNKILSLHAMDTVSLNRALFILALAKNDVRERIVTRFLESGKTELADAEYDFRRSSELKPHRTQKLFPPWDLTHLPFRNNYKHEEQYYEAVHRNAMQRYHFRNLSGFFDVGFVNPDTMNPMQREFIRMAQIFKARLVAEMELKQRVMERALIEERSNDEDARFAVMQRVHGKAMLQLEAAFDAVIDAQTLLLASAEVLDGIQAELSSIPSPKQLRAQGKYLSMTVNSFLRKYRSKQTDEEKISLLADFYQNDVGWQDHEKFVAQLTDSNWITSSNREEIKELLDEIKEVRRDTSALPVLGIAEFYEMIATNKDNWLPISGDGERAGAFARFRQIIERSEPASNELQQLDTFYRTLNGLLPQVKGTEAGDYIIEQLPELYQVKRSAITARSSVNAVENVLNTTRGDLDHRKLLNLMIDQQEDKFIELVEGTRSHIAVMDHYLKRLSIALEDDFKVQFYDPMFVRVRDAARAQEVNLGQVERTTILTNNRAFAKVDPQATMEFDLPKRQIAIKEAFDAAKALVEDTGALVNDPTFLAAFQMMGGSKQPTTVKNVVPGQSTSTDQQNMGLVPQQQEGGAPGSALQSLVPEPAIYKLETGTGFQIRPVIQPDGDSVVYDFDYMYTTNIREPVRADEKHLGRIKRHFVHTAVQTGNYELREISRYQVALKVSRTSQGVPLLQDIPILGAAFRPAPSAESSIQQNIILGQTNVYPTLFDLMGLRWAQQVVDLDHTSLLETEHIIRGRQKSMRDFVFGEASRRVDDFLRLNQESKSRDLYRPDFYHSQTLSSPHHPGGYVYPSGVKDPTGNGFQRHDRRPPEMQEPPYELYRHQPVHPERVGPAIVPEIPLNQPLGQSRRLRSSPTTFDEHLGRSDSQRSRRPNVGVAIYRDSNQGRGAAVRQVRFERSERPRRDVQIKIQRLPPVH